jgi:large subunit ribosomal protein L18
MNRLLKKSLNNLRRKNRIRSKVNGTSERPRLAVYISNLHVSAQIINDETSTTIVHVTTVGKKLEGSMTNKAKWVGAEIAKKAKKAKISKVVLDRSGKMYHGRIKVLADTAREEGLEF